MVIDGNNSINPGNVGSNRSKQAVSSEGSANSPTVVAAETSAQENVSLSQQAQNLSKLEANIQSAPGVDEDRVAALRKAIADGTYQVNANSVAGKILAQDELFS